MLSKQSNVEGNSETWITGWSPHLIACMWEGKLKLNYKFVLVRIMSK